LFLAKARLVWSSLLSHLGAWPREVLVAVATKIQELVQLRPWFSSWLKHSKLWNGGEEQKDGDSGDGDFERLGCVIEHSPPSRLVAFLCMKKHLNGCHAKRVEKNGAASTRYATSNVFARSIMTPTRTLTSKLKRLIGKISWPVHALSLEGKCLFQSSSSTMHEWYKMHGE